jgi:hypothetical protein
MTKKYFSFIVFCGLFIHFSHAQNWGNNQKDTRLFKELLKQTSEAIDYRVSVDRPYDTAVIDDILSFVQENQSDKRAYYFLLQLSWNHPNIYCAVEEDVKVHVFCSGFAQATNVNSWGHLKTQSFWAGRLLVDLGPKALPYLYGLLNDTTGVGYGWNFETKSTPFMEKWRRKDFAYRYAALIVGEKPDLPEKSEIRDAIIQQFTSNSLNILIKKGEKNELKNKDSVFRHLLEHPKDYDYLLNTEFRHPHIYCLLSDELKESLLCEAFYQARFADSGWGDLRSSRRSDNQRERLLIGLGTKMLPCLTLSLKDASPMPWDVTHGTNWRKKDFAYKYMLFIMGEKFVYTENVAERDSMIEALIARLKKK